MNKGTEQNDSVNPHFRAKKISLKPVQDYVNGIKAGNRTILSQAITLIESSKSEYRDAGQDILEAVLPLTGNSIRIGITGVPGVGKSTFIEAIGKLLIDQNHKIAALTIDPSSTKSKGSILGDKTRMPFLSTHDHAFIRPSPTSGTLGGVAQKTRETLLLCEAAGYDTIFIETVGVGQSETSVHSMVDMFLLLMLAGAGDELQGIKRGIMEMADLIAINKAEGDNKPASDRAKREYENALSLFPKSESGYSTKVLTCSALNSFGIYEMWQEIEGFIHHSKSTGYFDRNRKDQSLYWLHESVQRELKSAFYSNEKITRQLAAIEESVKKGALSPTKAAKQLLDIHSKR